MGRGISMLSRITKKRGFTLVEVLVAFVIFGIMAAMVTLIVQSTMKVKQQNLENAEMIEAQKRVYYQQNQPASDKDYEGSDGKIKLGFEGGSDLEINYDSADINDASDNFELNYYIGEKGNEAWKDKNNLKDDREGDEDDIGAMKGLDAGVYGSSETEYVIIGLEPRAGYENTYLVYAMPVAKTDADEDFKAYRQIYINFGIDIETYGYVGNMGENTTYSEAVVTRGGSGSILRIAGDSYNKSIYNLGDTTAACWVKLKNPLDQKYIDDVTLLFGTSGSGTMNRYTAKSNTSKNNVNYVKFYPFVDSKGVKKSNVFAAVELKPADK